MNIISHQPHVNPDLIQWQDPPEDIKGVELAGRDEAILLASHLGEYAVSLLNLKENIQGNLTGFLTNYSATFGPAAKSALELQGTLLTDIAAGNHSENPFSFRAKTPAEGAILKAAVIQFDKQTRENAWLNMIPKYFERDRSRLAFYTGGKSKAVKAIVLSQLEKASYEMINDILNIQSNLDPDKHYY